MFTGDFKTKRPVSLRGSSVSLSKSQFLKDKRESRFSRFQEKNVEKSLSRIGSWTYKIYLKWKFKKFKRENWNLGNYVTGTRELCWFYNSKLDTIKAREWLSKSCECWTLGLDYGSVSRVGKNAVFSWDLVIIKLLAKILDSATISSDQLLLQSIETFILQIFKDGVSIKCVQEITIALKRFGILELFSRNFEILRLPQNFLNMDYKIEYCNAIIKSLWSSSEVSNPWEYIDKNVFSRIIDQRIEPGLDEHQKIWIIGNCINGILQDYSVLQENTLVILFLELPSSYLVNLQNDETKIVNNAYEFMDSVMERFFQNDFLEKIILRFNALSMSRLLVLVFRYWPSKKNQICHLLLFKARNYVSMFFQMVKNGKLWDLLDSSTQGFADSKILGVDFEDDWTVLLLLGKLYSLRLFTMDDEEFYGPKNSIQLDSLICLARLLKNMSFWLLWTEIKWENSPLSKYLESPNDLAEQIAELCRHIYARDSRKSFCPSNYWHISSEADLFSFTQPLLSPAPDREDKNYSAYQERIFRAKNVLRVIPFIIPFELRVKLFRSFVLEDRRAHNLDAFYVHPEARITVHRSSIFEDGYAHLNALGSRLKGKIAISFISEHGLPEAGIDGGGVFKEFLTALSLQAFNPNYGLFFATKDQLLYPCPHSYATTDQQLSHFSFLGRMIGKALYEGVLVDVSFADFFLAKWIGKQGFLDDLPSLDPELYQGLIFLKNYHGDVEKDLALNFTVSTEEFGVSKSIDLIPNGSMIPVTNENCIQYVYLTAHYKVNLQIRKQCEAFFRGLQDLIDPLWIRMFNQKDLSILLGGSQIPIDLSNLKAHTTYGGDYHINHPTIILFWKVVDSLSENHLQSLIKFITSCPRPPLLGFGELRPLLCIRSGGYEVDRLPSASTCVNLLKLPEYRDLELLREKLLYAIQSSSGFELS